MGEMLFYTPKLDTTEGISAELTFYPKTSCTLSVMMPPDSFSASAISSSQRFPEKISESRAL